MPIFFSQKSQPIRLDLFSNWYGLMLPRRYFPQMFYRWYQGARKSPGHDSTIVGASEDPTARFEHGNFPRREAAIRDDAIKIVSRTFQPLLPVIARGHATPRHISPDAERHGWFERLSTSLSESSPETFANLLPRTTFETTGKFPRQVGLLVPRANW